MLRALQEEGVPIPEEVGVVGYSDIDLASHIYPSLSSVRREGSHGLPRARILLTSWKKASLGLSRSTSSPTWWQGNLP